MSITFKNGDTYSNWEFGVANLACKLTAVDENGEVDWSRKSNYIVYRVASLLAGGQAKFGSLCHRLTETMRDMKRQELI